MKRDQPGIAKYYATTEHVLIFCFRPFFFNQLLSGRKQLHKQPGGRNKTKKKKTISYQ